MTSAKHCGYWTPCMDPAIKTQFFRLSELWSIHKLSRQQRGDDEEVKIGGREEPPPTLPLTPHPNIPYASLPLLLLPILMMTSITNETCLRKYATHEHIQTKDINFR